MRVDDYWWVKGCAEVESGGTDAVLAADILKDWSWSGLGCGWLRETRVWPGQPGLSSLEGGSLASDKPISVARLAGARLQSAREAAELCWPGWRMARARSRGRHSTPVHWRGPPAGPCLPCLLGAGWAGCELPGRAKMSSVSPARAEAGHCQ